MTQTSPYQDPDTARLYAYIARDARTAVILRRGPRVKTLMIRWNLDTDTFEEGQWLHSKVYNERCDISPCGKYFLYFTGRFSGHYYAFTAISPVPYYTAHILWPKQDTWGGGGLFDADDNRILLNHRQAASPNGALKEDFTPDFGALPAPYRAVARLGEYSGYGEDGPIEHARRLRDGWTAEQTLKSATIPRKPTPAPDDPNVSFTWKTEGAMVWAKTRKDGAVVRLIRDQHGQVNGRAVITTLTLTNKDGTIRDFQRVDWADVDHDGDLLFARNGCLFRLPLASKDAPTQLIDLNNREVRNVPPPENMPKRRSGRDDNGKNIHEPWHPLDAE